MIRSSLYFFLDLNAKQKFPSANQVGNQSQRNLNAVTSITFKKAVCLSVLSVTGDFKLSHRKHVPQQMFSPQEVSEFGPVGHILVQIGFDLSLVHLYINE